MKRLRAGLIAAALAALVLVALPAGGAFARPSADPGAPLPPRSGAGPFVGIYAWGNGAPACARHQNDSLLYFDCSGVQTNFIGSYVLIRFPSRDFNAVVRVRKGDPQVGVVWYEQDITLLAPIVYNHGFLFGSDTATLSGASVPQYSPEWDLGLDSVLKNGGFTRPVNVTITITRK
jgi:hypothetical protein